MTDRIHRAPNGVFSFLQSIPLFRRDPLVAADRVTDRALISVIAIMTFLAAMTAGAAQFAASTTSHWQVLMASEVTVQLKPQGNRPIEGDIVRATDILRGTTGVTSVKVFSREQSSKLLEPWLGSASAIEGLPIPRLIAVRIDAAEPPDLTALGKAITDVAPGASLDDHRNWTRRLGRISDLFMLASLSALLLVLSATGLAIVFATRGAMAGNREIIEVLHFIGADDRYIAAQFQRHFAVLGIRGGAIGGLAALVLLITLRLIGSSSVGLLDGNGLSGLALPGSEMILATVLVISLVGVVAGVASRITVYRTIGRLA
jgi:cell division transport system permease protein